MSNPYKCTSHKLDIICQGCVKAWIARHNKLLKFVQDTASLQCCAFPNNDSPARAKRLLEELDLSENKDSE